MHPRNAIAERTTELLKSLSWSVYTLSQNSGLPTSTLFNVLHGSCKSCNFDTLLNICRAFKIELTEFFKGELFMLKNLLDDD